MRPDHDVAAGPLTRCQITGSTDLHLAIDLDSQPLCDGLLRADELHQPEIHYPLRLNVCPESGLAQLDYVVDPKVVFPPTYPYRSGITKELETYQRAFAQGVVSELGIPPQSLCVDIGSNDGTLLTGFRDLGMQVLGVEPTNVAAIAQRENNIETIQRFFSEALARDIVRDYGKARIITATNVFAHVALLGEVMRGIDCLLERDGVFVTESHYLLDVVEKAQFDTVYHEHIRTYSVKALVTLFNYYDFEVFDVRRADRYGGNLRAYVARRGVRPVAPSVGELLQLERERKLFDVDTYRRFRSQVAEARDRLMHIAYDANRRGTPIVGNSCPGRCSTLLNYYGMTRDLMPYIAEQPTSLKLGLHLPGQHIPIVNNQRLIDDQPDTVILLAWHYAEPIAAQLRARGLRSRMLVPLPQVREIEA